MSQTARLQDMPPKGGFAPIEFKRVPLKTYFGGISLFAGFIGISAGAAYLYFLSLKQVTQDEVERRSANFAIYPMLLAERDRELLKQMRKNRDEEEKLMANVKGWEVGTYYGEPIYHTQPRCTFIEPSYQEYYVHSSYEDILKRLTFSLWT